MSRKYRNVRRFGKKKIKGEKYVDSDPDQTLKDKVEANIEAEEDSEKDEDDIENL
jgi:hypothetical protein